VKVQYAPVAPHTIGVVLAICGAVANAWVLLIEILR
jgi:hypothetical protein